MTYLQDIRGWGRHGIRVIKCHPEFISGSVTPWHTGLRHWKDAETSSAGHIINYINLY